VTIQNLQIALACGAYDRTAPLRDGRVKPEGIDLAYLALGPAEIFWRQLKHQEFHASEMSLSAYIMDVAGGEPRFVGIPVFPSRVFRRAYVFVNAESGIERPEDLKGKRVAVPEYHMTAALFIRGFLSDDHGVRAEDVEWIQGGQTAPGRRERVELNLPEGIKLAHEPHRTIEELLLTGEVDALLGAYTPQSIRDGDSRVRRLYPDPVGRDKAAWKATGIFPIMHLVALRRDVYEHHPWVATSLRDAFVEAKRLALEELADHGASASMLPFFQWEMEQTVREHGEDFWPYGLESNRATLEAAVRYSYEQGLSARKVAVEELFPAALQESHVD
jgi:4,5-dihydroxyphthalate decarboxylase